MVLESRQRRARSGRRAAAAAPKGRRTAGSCASSAPERTAPERTPIAGLAWYISGVSRLPRVTTPTFSPPTAPQRRLPAPRALREYVPSDGDRVRLPVGPGAIHAVRYGHGGPVVLLVHGFTTSTPLWNEVASALLAAGCQVIVPDMLGFGESDRPLGGPFTAMAQARYLDRALALLRVTQVVAVGQDVGGVVLKRLAAIRPDRVASLMLCSTSLGDALAGPEIDAVREQTGPALLEISSRPLGVVDLLRPVLRNAVSDRSTVTDRVVARFAAPYTGSQGARHLLDLARAVAEDDALDAPAVSGITTMRVTGDDDPLVLPAATPVRRIPGAKRLVPLEQPAALAALIMEQVRVSAVSAAVLEETPVSD